MKEVIFLNGRFVLREEARVSVLEPGFLYGIGLFETMRAYRNKIVYLDRHLERIKNSCRLIGLRFPCSFDKLRSIISETVKRSGSLDAYVRLTLWKSAQENETGILVIARRYQPYPVSKYKKGFCVGVSSYRQADSLLARIKSANRLLYELSFTQAKEDGFDEALILNKEGFIAEASRSNIFLARDKQIFTPSLECGCLEGVTRGVVFDLAKQCNIKVSEGNFTLQDLYKAEEAFLTNSLIGIMPLASVEKKSLRKAVPGRLTRFFIKEYKELRTRKD